eukprot:CAMPEP_0204525642 /NCGR_PEP_ID=MMETSP0661-20131031/8014_1 /ASSEMBLY_ACC=CAM_ASM_000606 /TAXON_ID=109239 /ORGANISM="Alexandrium margalefi, Strain AMGDE01CS-322" /LENGTH=519 /DNA_ID=CAMNT_0051531447 /DNA_START=91 /DNA_END=1650 /DNA_ORIENTATION=-
MALQRFLRLAALQQLLCAGRTAAAEAPDGECAATGGCSPYYWPMARGPIGSASTSPFKGPSDLKSSLKWSWTTPEGKYRGSTSNGASLIDDKKNIYTMWLPDVYKFSPDGRVMWRYHIGPFANDVPALYDGHLYSIEADGHLIAINMETGLLAWRSEPVCSWTETHPSKCHAECDCKSIGLDIGALAAVNGVVTFKTHQPPAGGACKVMGANATTGEFLWDYATDHMIWNYYPIVSEERDSFIFQDSTGTVYRIGLDGREIWKAGTNTEGWYQTWTDGGLQLGPNGIVYSVKALGGHNTGPGKITAWRVSDGKFLWTSSEMTPEVPNAWPVIGRMRKDDPMTVIMASGRAGGDWPPFFDYILPQCHQTLPKSLCDNIGWMGLQLQLTLGDWSPTVWKSRPNDVQVWGLHADTGKVLWKWSPGVWKQGRFRGELERVGLGNALCIPNPVGNPTLDASGNLYIGMHDGYIYHLVRSSSGPGVEVKSKYDAGGAFSSGGVSLGPDMMVIASCETLYVFKGEA